MAIGYIRITVHTGDDALPVENARITIRDNNGGVIYECITDVNGNSEKFPLPAPDKSYTLDREYRKPAYSTFIVDVTKEGFVTKHIHGVEIVDTITSILPVDLFPLQADGRYYINIHNPTMNSAVPENNGNRNNNSNRIDRYSAVNNNNEPNVQAVLNAENTEVDIYIPETGLLIPTTGAQVGSNEQSLRAVIIPEYITVHLGIPTNAEARNVRVRFLDYIKNVVSSEIYPTWPDNSLIANIHVITTFALNRIYTEWYTSRGFNFDITNSTAYDQYFVEGRNIYENISTLVDQYFNVYARRFGFRNPFFTQYCNGTTSVCAGLSQWGTVDLAKAGYTPIQILRYFYPNDIELVETNNIQSVTQSYPGVALRTGSVSPAVQTMQNYLNRIRINFPLIPIISNPNGVFGSDTEASVRAFQRAFNMTVDGVIGKGTWNKITFIYVGIIRLAELDSEGERVTIGENPPNVVLSQGMSGADVNELQFILNFISPYYSSIPTLIKDSYFGTATTNAVIEFQKTFGLTRDGVVGPQTWNKLYAVYKGIQNNVNVPGQPLPPVTQAPPFPGTLLKLGSTGSDVLLMQSYLNTIRIVYNFIPQVTANGVFDEAMKNAVTAFQQQFLLTADGIIGPVTWGKIVEQFLLITGAGSVSTEFPGTNLSLGSSGSAVRLMQGFLIELRTAYPSIPSLTADGIFGQQTRAAVIAFQNLFGLRADGIIGPITWDAIVSQRNRLFGT